jgi:hypothetical protein
MLGCLLFLVGIFNNNEERCIFSLNDSTTQVAFVGSCVCITDGVFYWVLNISIRSLQLMDESSMLL